LNELIKGTAYLLGDDINTDDIVPSHTLTMRDAKEMANYTLEYIDPNFVKKTKERITIILAGDNFGTGSSREEAVNVFKILGVKAIIAKSFSRIYFRNLINLAIPGIVLEWRENQFSEGDLLELNLNKGKIVNKTKDIVISFPKLPSFLMKIIEAGGAINLIKKTLDKGI
jgi:3-isopropylmalate/(R)-2-methylmalate dehydratase small subunit